MKRMGQHNSANVLPIANVLEFDTIAPKKQDIYFPITTPNINDLPSEIIMEIFFHLPVFSLLNTRSVSVRLLQISQHNLVWNNNFANTFGGLDSGMLLWNELYFKQYHLDSNGLQLHDLMKWCVKRHCDVLLKSLLIKHSNQLPLITQESSLVYIASVRGFTKIVQLLLVYGKYGPDDMRIGDSSPLYVACQEGHFETVKLLIQHKADIDFKFREGFTPLYVACQRGNKNIAEYLIKCGANVNSACINGSSPLYIACQEGNVDTVELLVHHYANIEATFRRGFTPLYVACRNGHIDTMKKLISYGANINAIDEDGSSSVYVVSQNGHHEIAKELILAGANPEIPFLGGYAPLYVACQNGHHLIVKELLKCKSVDKNKIAPNGSSSLYIACQNGHYDVVLTLLESGVDVLTSSHGFTSLYIAVHKEHYEIVKLLLDHPTVNVDYINYNNQYAPTVLYAACHNNNLDMAKLLVQKGADALILLEGKNLMQIAIEEKFNEKIIDWLITNYYHLLFESIDKDQTPFELACIEQNHTVLKHVMTHCKNTKLNNTMAIC